MDVLLPYVIWMVLLLLAASVLAVLGFGVRGLLAGKVRSVSIASFAVPLVVFGVLVAFTGDWVKAAVLTLLVMFVLAGAGLLYTGARGMLY